MGLIRARLKFGLFKSRNLVQTNIVGPTVYWAARPLIFRGPFLFEGFFKYPPLLIEDHQPYIGERETIGVISSQCGTIIKCKLKGLKIDPSGIEPTPQFGKRKLRLACHPRRLVIQD